MISGVVFSAFYINSVPIDAGTPKNRLVGVLYISWAYGSLKWLVDMPVWLFTVELQQISECTFCCLSSSSTGKHGTLVLLISFLKSCATDFWMLILLVWFIWWYRKRGMLAPLIFWTHQRQEHAPVLGEHGVLLCEEPGRKRPLLAVTFSCATIDCFMWVVDAWMPFGLWLLFRSVAV